MRTTLDLPERLVQDAMKATHQKTKTAAIITALQDYVRKNAASGTAPFQGAGRRDH